MKNQTYRMTMLFDFYGDILTPRQRELFDLYYNEDLSLAEIAENCGISRQGVRDVIVRAENAMTELEDKTRHGPPAFCRCSSTWTVSSPLPGDIKNHQLPAVRKSPVRGIGGDDLGRCRRPEGVTTHGI